MPYGHISLGVVIIPYRNSLNGVSVLFFKKTERRMVVLKTNDVIFASLLRHLVRHFCVISTSSLRHLLRHFCVISASFGASYDATE